LILIFVLDLFVGKTMRRNNAFACSSRGRTIIPTEAAIEGAASRRGNDNGARGSRGGRGAAATAPRGGRARRLEFISEEDVLQQSQVLES
jgi:hypothetical protein